MPTYDLHERALDQATIVKDPLARVEIVAGVIDCICGGGMTAVGSSPRESTASYGLRC